MTEEAEAPEESGWDQLTEREKDIIWNYCMDGGKDECFENLVHLIPKEALVELAESLVEAVEEEDDVDVVR